MDLRELPTASFNRHPWETARADFFSAIVAAGAGSRPLRVLDVGAGDGYFGRRLLEALPHGSSVVCFDTSYTPAHLARLSEGAPPGLRFVARPDEQPRVDWLVLLDV